MAIEFEAHTSARGEPTTELERTALAELAKSRTCTNPWAIIGARIGADALAVVFDELQNEKIHVPSRQAFFGELLRERRNALIRELYARNVPVHEIATRAGVSERTVLRALHGATNRTTGHAVP